jgi:hypothetical protein
VRVIEFGWLPMRAARPEVGPLPFAEQGRYLRLALNGSGNYYAVLTNL